MRSTCFLATVSRGLLMVAAIAVAAATQTAPPNSQITTPPGQEPPASQSGYVLKVKTRLVTLEVVATDSHGNVVRDLKPDDLQIVAEHNQPQKIAHFEFLDARTLHAKPAAPPDSGKSYSNQAAFEHLTVPPTVVLMDALNTPVASQMQGRTQMVRLLKTLPSDTPVAVFLLGHTLRLVQGFTSDPALLRAAADKVTGATAIQPDSTDSTDLVSSDDPDSPINLLLELSDGVETNLSTALEDFDKEQNANSVDLRARETLESLSEIARYLSGVPGRKNLLWLSQSFPISILPDANSGSGDFAGVRAYGGQVEATANALVDAQVAVYPVDIRGLAASQTDSAAQRTAIRRNSPGGGFGTRLDREQDTVFQSQGTMEELARDTGGKTCQNTNDLSRCVKIALDDGGSYYELAFYPQNIPWDGKFHRFTVKSSRSGIKLAYRRGYFALDGDALASVQSPEASLRQACSDLMPSTTVHLLAQPLPPAGPPDLRYLVIIDPGAVSISKAGDVREIDLQTATCLYSGKSSAIRMEQHELKRAVPEELLQDLQTRGIGNLFAIEPDSELRRIRFVVLDVASGLTGSVDVPVSPADIAAAAKPVVQIPKPAVTPIVAIPDRDAPDAELKPMGALTFNGPGGQAGTLDWNGDTLIYKGNLPIAQSAPAFFAYAFGARFACVNGALAPNRAADGPPRLQFAFRNHDGKIAVVNLQGTQAQYSGDLPVDVSAAALFDRLWSLARCQRP